MGLKGFSGLFATLLVVILAHNGLSTELVPVYMWETSRTSHKAPAIGPVNAETFKELMLSKIAKNNPRIVVFAEPSLSPEDFIGQDKNIFEQLSQISTQAKVTYYPLVEKPIEVIQQLPKEFKEISVDDIKAATNNDILLVNLNDAKDDEDRIDMLQRHDEKIVEIYKSIVESNKQQNVLAIFTGIQSSWIVPEEITHQISKRATINESSSTTKLNATGFLMYASTMKYGDEYLVATGANVNENVVTIPLNNSKDLTLTFSSGMGYWFLDSIQYDTVSFSNLSRKLYAPNGFSYHCSNANYVNDKNRLDLIDFQVQFRLEDENNTASFMQFGDAYDCVGFTTAPIWSGLFITFILALIMTLGLTMMMDIKTMDRFDDPKGKTIVVNASE